MKTHLSYFQISIQEKHFNLGKNTNIVTPTARKPATNHGISTVTGSHKNGMITVNNTVVNGHHGNHGVANSHHSNQTNGNHGNGSYGNHGNNTVCKANNVQKNGSNGNNGSAVSLERFVVKLAFQVLKIFLP